MQREIYPETDILQAFLDLACEQGKDEISVVDLKRRAIEQSEWAQSESPVLEHLIRLLNEGVLKFVNVSGRIHVRIAG